jgi:hypothetical protein
MMYKNSATSLVMPESQVARCMHHEEEVASSNFLLTVHTSCHPTLQHHNSYNRTENHRQCNAVDLLMMGVKTPKTC